MKNFQPPTALLRLGVLTSCLSIAFAFAPAGVEAQVGDATMTASSASGVSGDVVPISVTLNSTTPSAGFSYGLRADALTLGLGNIAISPFLQSLKGGAGPDFVTINPYTTLTGFSFGVILSFGPSPDATIPANVDHLITTFDATVLAGAPVGVTLIELRSDLSDPGGVPVEVLATTLTGGEMTTTGVAGTFEVLGNTETATLEIVGQTAPTAAGEVATARVFVEGSAEIGGLSYGLAHDPLALSLSPGSVGLGVDLAATRGGLGPEYLSIDLFPGGFTFATVVNVTAAGVDLLPTVAHEITTISYDVLPTATYGPSALTFTELLGTPPVLLSVGLGLVAVEPPVVIEDSIFVARPFLRGDANQNGFTTVSDVTFLLDQLFAGAVLTCPDAADIDSNGVLSIADVLYFLEFLFDEGPGMAAPIAACALPPVPPTLGCDSFSCP